MIDFEEENMGKCPYCKEKIGLDDVITETKGKGVLKQEIMYVCPYCENILGFNRGKYTA